MENTETLPLLIEGHLYLTRISMVVDIEVFKICLEHWHALAESLYNRSSLQGQHRQSPSPRRQRPLSPLTPMSLSNAALLLGSRADANGTAAGPYAAVLSTVRLILIQRMAKPEEVLFVFRLSLFGFELICEYRFWW